MLLSFAAGPSHLVDDIPSLFLIALPAGDIPTEGFSTALRLAEGSLQETIRHTCPSILVLNAALRDKGNLKTP